jgi:HPt (histidine-containing phosphotransfer) domain-containing protein
MNSKDSDQTAFKAGVDAAKNRQPPKGVSPVAGSDGPSSHNPAAALPYDLQSSLVRLGGSQDLFRSLVEFFLEDCPGLIQQLHTGLDHGDTAQVERAGHSIKGLAANFSAAEAVQAAMKVEELGRAGDVTAARKALPELETELDRLLRALSAYLQAPNS